MEMFTGQSWFQIVGEIVFMFTVLTGALPDRWVQKIPVLGTVWPIFNWLAGNIFNNISQKFGIDGCQMIELKGFEKNQGPETVTRNGEKNPKKDQVPGLEKTDEKAMA